MTMAWKSTPQMTKQIMSSWSLWKTNSDDYRIVPILTVLNRSLQGIFQVPKIFLLRQGSTLKVLKGQGYAPSSRFCCQVRHVHSSIDFCFYSQFNTAHISDITPPLPVGMQIPFYYIHSQADISMPSLQAYWLVGWRSFSFSCEG